MRISMFFYVLFILLFNNTLEANAGRDDNHAQVEAYSGHPKLKPLQQAAGNLVEALNQWVAVASKAPNSRGNGADIPYNMMAWVNLGEPDQRGRRFLDTLSHRAEEVHQALKTLEQELLKGAGMKSTDRRTVDRSLYGVCSSLWKWMGMARASEKGGCLLSVSPDQTPFYEQLVRYVQYGYAILTMTELFFGNDEQALKNQKMARAAKKRYQVVSDRGVEVGGINSLNTSNVLFSGGPVQLNSAPFHEETLLKRVRDWQQYHRECQQARNSLQL